MLLLNRHYLRQSGELYTLMRYVKQLMLKLKSMLCAREKKDGKKTSD